MERGAPESRIRAQTAEASSRLSYRQKPARLDMRSIFHYDGRGVAVFAGGLTIESMDGSTDEFADEFAR